MSLSAFDFLATMMWSLVLQNQDEVDIKVGQVFTENKRIRGWEVLDSIPLRGNQNRILLRGKLTFC